MVENCSDQSSVKELVQFDRNRHGSLHDRGSADAWYGRRPKPHWYPDGTYNGHQILVQDPKEVAEYMSGYRECVGSKEW
jgi:hypothetical protein